MTLTICCTGISIHVLRKEDDHLRRLMHGNVEISIHVLREEDDGRMDFESLQQFAISIHVLREEDDPTIST